MPGEFRVGTRRQVKVGDEIERLESEVKRASARRLSFFIGT